MTAALAVGAAAQSDGPIDLAELEAAAQEEGALTFYTVQQESVNDAIASAFEEKYGIPVNFLDSASADARTRLQAEIDAGQVLADIASVSERTFLRDNDSAFADVTSLPSWQAYPEEFRAERYALTSLQPKPVLVNTDLVAEGEITSFEDLLDPKWKDLIVFSDPLSARTNASFIVELHKRFGDEFMAALGEQNPAFQAGSGGTSQIVASGEKAIGASVSYSAITPLLEAGAPVAPILLDPEQGAEIFTAVTADAQHPNAALLMLNFLMSPEGQEIMNGGGLGVSPLPDIPGTLEMSPYYFPTNEDISGAELAAAAELLGR